MLNQPFWLENATIGEITDTVQVLQFDRRTQGDPAMTPKLPSAIPEIPVTNIDDALAYYRDCLGFSLDWGSQQLGLAGISKEGCRLFLASREYRKDFGNHAPILLWLNLESIEEVDDLYRTWALRKARLKSSPESKPWGLHEFTVEDIDGNLFRVFYDFATPTRNDS